MGEKREMANRYTSEEEIAEKKKKNIIFVSD